MSIQDFLRSRNIPFQVLLHPPVPSATRRAQSLHISGHRVAKAVLIRAEEQFVLAVLPATCRIDLDRLAQVMGCSSVRLATEDEAQNTFFDCEIGACPPFGKIYGVDTWVDARLVDAKEIVVEANLRHEDMRLLVQDYLSIEKPIRAQFARTIHPQQSQVAKQVS